jgi:hypothetical protein
MVLMAKRKNPAAVALGKRSAKARMKKLTPEKRSEVARIAVTARWKKAKDKPTTKGE